MSSTNSKMMGFMLIFLFSLAIVSAQNSQAEQLKKARELYELSKKENQALASDPSNDQRRKTIKSIRKALDAYAKIMDQFPELTETVTEEVVTLNSWAFWTKKFAPIDFVEDETEESSSTDSEPEETLEPAKEPEEENLEPIIEIETPVKKVAPLKLVEKKPLRQTKFPVETDYYFRQKIAKLLQNRRLFEALDHCKRARKNALHAGYKKELTQLEKEIEGCLDFYKKVIDLSKESVGSSLNFRLITKLKFTGTIEKFDKKSLLVKTEDKGTLGVNFFMLSTKTLMALAELKNATDIEYLGAVFSLLEGKPKTAGTWFEKHKNMKGAEKYLKQIKTFKSRAQEVKKLNKERTKKFKETAKQYKVFNEVLSNLSKEDLNKALYQLSKLYPILKKDSQKEMEEFLLQETQQDWRQLVTDLRYECSKCNKQRELECSKCKGAGKVKQATSFGARPTADGYFKCGRCRGKGRTICLHCGWRYSDPKAKKVEEFFIQKKEKKKTLYDSSKKATLKGKIQWGDLLSEKSNVILVWPGTNQDFRENMVPDTDIQGGGYFLFEVPYGKYDLLYWKNKRLFREPVELTQIEKELTLQITSSLSFDSPEKNDELMERPVFLQWEKEKEEYFVVKLFEKETKRGASSYRPVLIKYTVGNFLHLSKKQTRSKKEYILIVNGYGGSYLMTQGKITFKVK